MKQPHLPTSNTESASHDQPPHEGGTLNPHRHSFALDLAAIRGIRRWLETRAQEARLNTMQQGHVALVASELLVNLLEHAQPTPDSVELLCEVGNGSLTTEIRASSHSFDGEEAFHAALSEPEDVDAMADGGMGLYLIAQFTSELHYQPARGRDRPEVFTFRVDAV